MPDLERHTDAELVTAFRGGDRAAFEGIYDRYADRIHSYCLTMLRSRDQAADASAAAFVAAATRLQQEEDPGELRPWLFGLARTEVRAEGRQRARTLPGKHPAESEDSHQDRDMPAELRGLVW